MKDSKLSKNTIQNLCLAMTGKVRPKRLKTSMLLALITSVSACGELVTDIQDPSLVEPPEELVTTQAPPPRSSGFSPVVKAQLECINDSRALRDMRFAIAVHADGTGKSSGGYEGGTGSFLPQGTSAIWVAQAVMFAGGTAQNYYELNTERAIRQFAGEIESQRLSGNLEANAPQFIVSTAFTALDFLGGENTDVRVAGVGPRSETRGASIEVSAEIYRPGDRTTLAISSMNRQVIYRSTGIGAGAIVGPGSGVLVTGEVSYTDQQRLQEASRDLIGIAVADVLSRVPGVPQDCSARLEAETRRPAQQTATAAAASADQPTPDAINATRIAVGAFGLESNAVETQRRLAAAGLEATSVADRSRRLWLVYVEAGRETGALGKIRDLGYRDAYYVT